VFGSSGWVAGWLAERTMSVIRLTCCNVEYQSTNGSWLSVIYMPVLVWDMA
jgi:hypothetical protein